MGGLRWAGGRQRKPPTRPFHTRPQGRLMSALCSGYYCPHCTEEETEVLRDSVAPPGHPPGTQQCCGRTPGTQSPGHS